MGYRWFGVEAEGDVRIWAVGRSQASAFPCSGPAGSEAALLCRAGGLFSLCFDRTRFTCWRVRPRH